MKILNFIITFGILSSFEGFACGEIPSLGHLCSLKIDTTKMSFYEFEKAYSNKPSSMPQSNFSKVCDFKDRLLSLSTFEERNALINSKDVFMGITTFGQKFPNPGERLKVGDVLGFGYMILIKHAPNEFTQNSPYMQVATEAAQRYCGSGDINFEIYKSLIEKNLDLEIGFSALSGAARMDRIDILQLLMDYEISFRERNPFSVFPVVDLEPEFDSQKDPPLGADIINSVTQFGQTLLHENISCYSHLGTMQFLIENGADIHALDKDGRSPLFYAALGVGEALSLTLIKEKFNFLLSKNANINQKNQYGRTLLHEVVYYSHYYIYASRYSGMFNYYRRYCDCSINQFNIRIQSMLTLLMENGADIKPSRCARAHCDGVCSNRQTL